MSKCFIKTILSPVLLIVILFTAMFTVSAETKDQNAHSRKYVFYDKKISTLDEEDIPNEANTIPTMKPSYYNAVNSQVVAEQSSDSNKTLDGDSNNSDNVSDTTEFDDERAATPELGAVSQTTTADTLNSTTDLATADETFTKGVVNTGDTSVSVFVLLTLISLSCLLIGIHKKELTE